MIRIGRNLLGLVIVFSFGFTSPAFAYLDPGTGSMILQLLLGGVAGALVIGKLYWQKLKDLFRAKAEPSSSDIQDK